MLRVNAVSRYAALGYNMGKIYPQMPGGEVTLLDPIWLRVERFDSFPQEGPGISEPFPYAAGIAQALRLLAGRAVPRRRFQQ